jgi:hypothetical protein
MSFRVRIMTTAGAPAPDITVVLRFKSFTRIMTAAEMTDREGDANFEGHEDGVVEIFVDGLTRGEHQYLDGQSLTLSQ